MNSQEGMYLFADPFGDLPDDEDLGASRALRTGFFGLRAPWSATVFTGTRGGPVRLTIEVHDSRVDAEGIGNVWSEIIEVTFRSRSGDLEVREWGGEPVHTFEALLLPPGPWRLRVHARGRDEGNAASGPELIEPVEEHLIQFWAGPNIGDVVVDTKDEYGKTLRRGREPRL